MQVSYAVYRRSSIPSRHSIPTKAVLAADAPMDVAKVRSFRLPLGSVSCTCHHSKHLSITPYVPQMSPLGDRLLVKPKEQESVRIYFVFRFLEIK